MERRRFVGLLACGLSGCTGIEISGSSTPDTTTSPARTTSQTAQTTTGMPTTTTTGVEHDLVSASPEQMPETSVESRLQDVGCDGLGSGETTCNGSIRGVSFIAESRLCALPRCRMEFVLRNDADEQFNFGPFGWKLYKFAEGRWRRIAPLQIPALLGRVPGGGEHPYELTVDNDRFFGVDGMTAEKSISLSGLGPGVYGLVQDGYFESEPDTELTVGVMFGLWGEGPPVGPTGDVTDVTVDGTELRVRSATAGNEQGAELVLHLGARTDDTVELLPEHVLQTTALRNSVPFAATPDVDTIRYRAHESEISTGESYLGLVAEGKTGAEYSFQGISFGTSSSE